MDILIIGSILNIHVDNGHLSLADLIELCSYLVDKEDIKMLSVVA
jgi:hypothetical protein